MIYLIAVDAKNEPEGIYKNKGLICPLLSI